MANIRARQIERLGTKRREIPEAARIEIDRLAWRAFLRDGNVRLRLGPDDVPIGAVRNRKGGVRVKTIAIDGVIGVDVFAKDVRRELDQAAGAPVTLEINSPGGSVFESVAVRSAIRDYKGETIARIISIAASGASYITTAADRVIALDNAVWMIHNPRMLTIGDHRRHTKSAEILLRLTELLATGYANRCGKSEDEVRADMDAELYLYGQEIVDHGYADELEGDGEAEGRSVAFARARETIAQASGERIAALDTPDRIAALLGSAPEMSAGAQKLQRIPAKPQTADEKRVAELRTWTKADPGNVLVHRVVAEAIVSGATVNDVKPELLVAVRDGKLSKDEVKALKMFPDDLTIDDILELRKEQKKGRR